MDNAGEDGYELWLRYRKVDNPGQLAQYRTAIHSATVLGKSATADIIKSELARALPVLLDRAVSVSEQRPARHALVVGTAGELAALGACLSQADCRRMGEEGFLIRSHQHAGNTERAVLVGTFHFLRLLQTRRDIATLDLSVCPQIRHRVLGHWDNLDGSIERGYAGSSLWNWDQLPEISGTRYHDYAQANWYAFGRLAWDCDLSTEAIAEEWVRMTWSNDPLVVAAIKTMMLGSWEACVNYMTPLGLHDIMQEGHHYGPDPGFHAAPRADWNNVY